MREIELRNRAGEVVARAVVDDEDYERVSAHRWCLNGRGYVVTAIGSRPNRKMVQLHRFIAETTDPAVKVDHRNRDPLDNRRVNLRPGTDATNAQNRDPQGRGGSGYRGVRWAPRNKKWRVQITLGGQRISLGLFTDVHEAGAVATAWRAEHMPFSQEAGALV